MKIATILALSLLSTAAIAQQQPDPAFLAKAVQVLQAQRNEAQDLRATAEARIMMLAEENAKLKAEVDALKKGASDQPATSPSTGQ